MSLTCLFCGEPEFMELFEVWGRDFQVATCCEDSHAEAVAMIEADPAGAARWLAEQGAGAVRRVVDDEEHLVIDFQLDVRPIDQAAAKAFIREHHEHNPPPAGDRFRGSIWNGPTLLGVCMVGRPVGRGLDHTRICEVNRLCLDRSISDQLRWKAASELYTWAATETRKRGYAKVITYTLESESGMSLRYARWKREAKTKGGSWNTPSRPREDKAPTEPKWRWSKTFKEAA